MVQLDKWTFNGPEGQESVAINSSPFLVNSADAMKTAITSGMGVGLLPVIVLPVVYALTFDAQTLTPEDQERVEAAGRARAHQRERAA